MNKVRNILWGLVLITVGVIIGLNKLEITNINLFFNGFWTLFIIIPCFIDLFKDNDKTADLIGLLIGVLLLLACQGYNYFDILLELIIPIILVILGISLIFKNSFSKKIKKMKTIKKSEKEVCSTFSGQNVDYKNEEFDGINLTAVFGGIELDLRDAIIKEDVVINTTAVFGGIDILVPSDVNVIVTSTSIFGGVDNKIKKNDYKKTLYINASCVFGGVEVK